MKDLRYNRTFSILISFFVAIMLLLPANTFAAENRLYVDSSEELLEAIRTVNNGSGADLYSIYLTEDITLNGKDLNFKKGSTIIYGEGHAIKFLNNSNILLLNDAKLSLGAKGYDKTLGIIGSGGQDALISNGYDAKTELNMYDGVTLTNDGNMTTAQTGAVQITGRSKFNMYGGKISDFYNAFSVNGGVALDNLAEFYMLGGVIENCVGVSGGAIAVYGGKFVMDGGIIRNSKDVYNALEFNGGGGVYVGCYSNGTIGDYNVNHVKEQTFIMNGGLIENCKAAHGGGVSLFGYDGYNYLPYFEMNGGVIRNCVAGESGGLSYGGGLFNYAGKAVIGENAKIYNNKAMKLADDIMSFGGEEAKLFLNSNPATWDPGVTLDSTGKNITRWYDDGKTRWELPSNDSDGYLKLVDMDSLKNNPMATLSLKAAHGRSFTLSYETNGGLAIDKEVYEEGTNVVLDNIPTRENYKFMGWYANEDFNQKLTSVEMTKDITVYAMWECDKSCYGGSGDDKDEGDGQGNIENAGKDKNVVVTGDDNKVMLLLSLVLISGVCIVVIGLYNNKKLRKNK